MNRTLLFAAVLLAANQSTAGTPARMAPLKDQTIPPVGVCSQFVHEVGKKAKGLVYVSNEKGGEARLNIDGHDEVVRIQRGSRQWERKDGTPPRYEFVEKDLQSTSTITPDIRAYGPYFAEDHKREGNACRGTIAFTGRHGTEEMKVEGECSC